MGVARFEELVVWQKAKMLAVDTYTMFAEHKDFSFRDQMQRAAVSVMNNIAEGFERRSNSEFKQFLYIAKGSCGELRSMLILAKELKKLSDVNANALADSVEEVSKILSGLIKSL